MSCIRLGWRHRPPLGHVRSNSQWLIAKPSAVIIGTDQCEVPGRWLRAAAPVLALCRELIEAGHDPSRPLHVYRGDVLALRVRSIAEAARLSIRGDGVGFRYGTGMVGASLVRAYSDCHIRFVPKPGSCAAAKISE